MPKKKYKVCLEYHIGNCNAPCVGFQNEEEYNLSIRRIREILKGKFSELKEFMQIQMDKSAENLEFESAEKWKQRVLKLKDFETKSVIFNPSLHEILALNMYISTEKKVINYLKVINGTVVATKSYEVETKLEETDIEIYDHVIQTLLLEHPDVKEVLVPLEVSKLPLSKRMTIPLLGDKKKLLDLCYINARSYAMSLVVDPKFQKRRSEFNILKELQDKLKLTELPAHIECFDNSNIQGTSPVSACVVFKGGKPAKKDYRHFHVKSVEGPNDFDTMKEVVFRRYKRMLDEGEDLPNLIVVDGGKGQLSSAIESLDKLGISEKVPIIGIAKRLEEIYFKNDPIPLYIDKKSPALKLIQHMRDEAHRFGITFHRQTRSKKMIGSQLDEIEGFGAKTIQRLYKKFKHIEGMRNAPYEELVAEIGQKRAEQLRSYFES